MGRPASARASSISGSHQATRQARHSASAPRSDDLWSPSVKCEQLFASVPDNRGKRTPRTLLAIDERDRYLIEAARHFSGASDREIARRLRIALLRYREGAWRRTRGEAICPPRHAGRLEATLWSILKVRDHVPSERLIRAVLSRSP